MAADMASQAKKGAVVCDSFGFVTAVRPIVHITPAKPEESKRDRDRSRDRSRNRDRDRDRDKVPFIYYVSICPIRDQPPSRTFWPH